MVQMTRSSTRLMARTVVSFFLLSFLAACGTTSSLQQAEPSAEKIDLTAYQHVVIADFEDEATENKVFKSNEKGQAKKAEYRADVKAAGVTFAEYVQAELDKLNFLESVSRGDEAAGEGALLIDGKVTRFERGNAAAKFLIGLGAGSTYFDALVRVRDASTGEELGTIVVDKNSWVLGGVISASQNVEGFMRGGAQKVAREVYIAKMGKEPDE